MPPGTPSIPADFARSPRWRRVAGVVGLAGVAASTSGCFYNESGLPPAINSFYYPTGLAVSPGRSTLYVANSDFDLQYNGGTVQVLDLTVLRTTLAPLLAGIRCTEQLSASGAAGSTVPLCAQNLGPAGNEWNQPCNNTTTPPIGCPTGLTCSPYNTCGVIGDVCSTFSATLPSQGQANGASCSLAGDCASGLCNGNGVCAKCTQASDCYGANDPKCPGVCDIAAGVCQLTCVSNNYVTPSACSPLSAPYIATTGTIGAFASGAVIARNPAGDGKARLFVPVRGDPSITWFDIADDGVAGAPAPFLDCGQSASNTRCSDDHRLGVDPYDNFRDETLPVEPVGLDISDDGVDVVTAHQIPNGPAVGLSINTWGGRPTFQFELTGNVAAGPSNIAHIPEPAIIAAAAKTSSPLAYEQGFLMTYNATAEVDIFRVSPDATSSPPRPFLSRASQTPVTVNQTGTDSRGIAVDSTERRACEAACAATDLDCLAACTDTPLRAFIANRTPPSLLIGEVETTIVASDVGPGTGTGVFDTLQIYTNAAPLPQGPSNVAFGQILDDQGVLQTLVFAVSFDTRRVSVYDPVTQRLISPTIATGRGPQAIAFDACDLTTCPSGEAPHAYLYVGHFTDSYIGVVDLDMRHPETFGTMFASIGVPIPPVETQ